MREVKLSSGAVLKVAPSPFAASKALYQAILKEVRAIEVSASSDVASLLKNAFCAGFSSPEVERCLWECMKKCTYNGGNGDFRIDENTFEPVEARDDYMKVCVEVAKENVLPFVKSLYAEWQIALATMPSVQA